MERPLSPLIVARLRELGPAGRLELWGRLMRMTQALSEAGYRHRGASPEEARRLAREAMRRTGGPQKYEEKYLARNQ